MSGAGPVPGVRRLGPEDWETYRAIRLEMLRDSPDAFWTSYDEAAGLDEATWRERLTGGGTLLAELGGEPVGSVTTWAGPPGEDEPGLTNLVAMYVSPSARRRGVGAALVRAALLEARAQGRHVVHLEVASSNHGARSLYERTGFRATGVTRPHPRRPELHEAQLECRLGG